MHQAKRAHTGSGRTSTSSWLAVYSGQECAGHIIHRGKTGWEAFDCEDRSIGLRPTQGEAVTAVFEAAAQEPAP